VILLAVWNRRGIDEVLRRSAAAEVSYREQGETLSDVFPDGYRHDRRQRHLGHGEMAWDRAREAIRLWEAHRFAGFTVTPPRAPIEPGVTVVASRAIGPVVLAIPCRIIYRTDEADRFGFAYGTLPGHPERGEEAFHIRRGPDDSVTAQIAAFSMPADIPTRMAAPIARRFQYVATSRYLKGSSSTFEPPLDPLMPAYAVVTATRKRRPATRSTTTGEVATVSRLAFSSSAVGATPTTVRMAKRT
jgi:uncharacterized protein (UPF0548 family)